MKNFGIAVFAGGVFGGLSSLALLPVLLDSTRDLEIGGVKIPIEVQAEIYDRDQLVLAVFLASASAAILAGLVMLGMMPKKRRRRS